MSRLELFKDFMKARALNALHDKSTVLESGKLDNKSYLPIKVSILEEGNYSQAVDDIIGSLEEYYDMFLNERK